MWIFIVLAVLIGGFFYIGLRIIPPAGLLSPFNVIAWIVLFLFIIILPLSFSLMRNGNEHLNDRFAWITYVVMGFLSFLLTFLLLKDALWLVGLAGTKVIAFLRASFSAEPTATQANPERRLFLTNLLNLGVLGLAGGFTLYGIYEARRRPAIRRINVPIAHLPAEFEGFTIVQITDIHAGLTVKRDFVETIVDMVNELKPDMIAFTGDMVDGSVPHLRNDVEPLSALTAPYGKFFITGNHEYYSGVLPWVQEAKRMGFTVLLNEHQVIERGSSKLLLAGVTDFSAGHSIPNHASDPGKAIENAPRCDARILLAHQPRSLFAALPHQFDLMISGHTHGGQFFPWNLAAAAGQPYIEGLHKHEHMWVYVSRGTGYWGPPVRVAARSEVTVLTLVKG